jgi:hypothetical protein
MIFKQRASADAPFSCGRPTLARSSGCPAARDRNTGLHRWFTAADQPGRPVIELDCGITVYPARFDGDRCRAIWYEDGQRQQCESVREDKLADRLERVTERLRADAPNMRRTGADLIAWYLDPDRHPAKDRWSRKHAHTQRRLCERFAAPVIDTVTCQDIKTGHMQRIVNAAPTAGEGTLKTRALVRSDLDDFVACYNPVNRHERAETERFRTFSYDELIARDKASLDIFWLCDESLEDSENLPAPEVIAAEIVEDLQAALDQFAAIAASLGGSGVDLQAG